MFKGHCFPKAIILQTVYFKLRLGLSYRDVEELLSIRGVKVEHATIQRWVYEPQVDQIFNHFIGLSLCKFSKSYAKSYAVLAFDYTILSLCNLEKKVYLKKNFSKLYCYQIAHPFF
ncbi:MAG: IS6 family transposase [Lutibacter sp.]|nr:IS6 family transposase [Lutibacter sp.]